MKNTYNIYIHIFRRILIKYLLKSKKRYFPFKYLISWTFESIISVKINCAYYYYEFLIFFDGYKTSEIGEETCNLLAYIYS